MTKTFDCNACGDRHQRPINSKCTRIVDSEPEYGSSVASAGQSDINLQILNELKSLNDRMSAMEEGVGRVEKPSKQPAPVVAETSAAASNTASDSVIPSLDFLRTSDTIQARVDDRIKELQGMYPQGKFKSQRGGSDTYWCKREVPWPQNHILSGTSKSRVTYDNLSMAQWVAGFCAIIKDESNVQTNNMLSYVADLMEDCYDFGWQSAKGAHAVVLCHMEESKVNWDETNKLDCLRRVHAQRTPNSNTSLGRKFKSKDKGIPCRFYQKGTCGQKTEHENGGQLYLHVCENCFAKGKSHPHAGKDCRKKYQKTSVCWIISLSDY